MGRVMRRGRWGILAHKGRSLCARESDQRSSQGTTKSKRDGLTGEADEGGGRPRKLGGEGTGDIGAGVAGNEVQESLTLVTDGAESGDNKGSVDHPRDFWEIHSLGLAYPILCVCHANMLVAGLFCIAQQEN